MPLNHQAPGSRLCAILRNSAMKLLVAAATWLAPPVGSFAVAAPIAPTIHFGAPIAPEDRATGVVEPMSIVLERDQLQSGVDLAEPERRGVWAVPKPNGTFFPYSGEQNLVNQWGDTCMGISFPAEVSLVGVYVAGQASPGVWTTGIRALGFRDGREVASTEWFTDIGARPVWFEIGLEGVDRVVFQSTPVFSGAGWYALDDLTYAATDEDSGTVETVVLDFEDCQPGQRLTGSNYAGLAWEPGMGDFASGEGIPAPRTLHQEGDDEEPGDTGGPPDRGGTLPERVLDFQGVIRGDAGQFSYPPDTCGAAGPDHFVEVVNTVFAVYLKASGQRVFSSSLAAFLPGSSGDPRVLFDQHSGRWVVIISDFNTRIYLAVSASNDPTGAWFKTNIVAASGSDTGCFPDYPTLGVDARGIYVASYMVGCGMTIFAFDKAPLIAPGPSLGAVSAFRGLPFEGAIQPVHTYGDPGVEFCVSRQSATGLRIRAVSGPLSAPFLEEVGSVSIPSHALPPDVPSLGSNIPLDSVDHRLMNAVFRDGAIWTAHAIGLNGRAACRWYQIETDPLAMAQSGTLADPVLHFFFPSIAVNARGDAVMGFSGAESSRYAGAYYTGRLAADAPGQMAPPFLLREGSAPQNNIDGFGRNRWGDYSLTTLDPSDQHSLWTIQEYAHATNIWGTWIAHLSYGDCNNNGIEDELDIQAGTSDDCNDNTLPDECEPDCNSNGVMDECDLSAGVSVDCQSNGVPDECDIAVGLSHDCTGNGVPDECETDCNGNGVRDDCDIASGTSDDCNLNAVPDDCEVDCNMNGITDDCDIGGGTSLDCLPDGTPDECQPDCNTNGVADGCDVAFGASLDCQPDGVPDECQLGTGGEGGVVYQWDDGTHENTIGLSAGGTVAWLNHFTVAPEGGVIGRIDLAWGLVAEGAAATVYLWDDPDGDGDPTDSRVLASAATMTASPDTDVFTAVDLADTPVGSSGTSFFVGAIITHPAGSFPTSLDQSSTPVLQSWIVGDSAAPIDPNNLGAAALPPSEISTLGLPGNWMIRAVSGSRGADCNSNGTPDDCDIQDGVSGDCDSNGRPDECEDCNLNGLGDSCDIAAGTSADCNANAVPDECDITGEIPDCDGNGIPDDCQPDCNDNEVADSCDIAQGSSLDCDGNAVPDECDPDCNANGVADACDIAAGTSLDCQPNGVPDECDAGGSALLAAAFESGLPAGWTASGLWHVTGACPRTGECDGSAQWAYFGADPACNFSTGARSAGELTAPSIIIPPWVRSARLEFCSSYAGEAGDSGVSGFDWAWVEVNGVELIDVSLRGDALDWTPLSADLTPYAGQAVTLSFNFDSLDGITNAELGWQIDRVEVIAAGVDCNLNGTPDDCDIADGHSADCDANAVPDECEDCNTNGVGDACDIAAGTSLDCNGNVLPDECEVAAADCNADGVPDDCDIAAGTSTDCNFNGTPDECDIAVLDCNANATPDDCDVESGGSADCNQDVIPDECQLPDQDCNTNGVLDACEVAAGCEPDLFDPGQDISSACAGVTLEVVSTDGSVHAVPSPFTSTGDQVFGDQAGFPFWDDSGLRVDFGSPPAVVSIDVVSDDASDTGVLDAFGSDGVVCDSETSANLGMGQSQTLTVQCSEGIDHVIARAAPCCVLFDHLVFNAATADCDANGVPDECDPDCNTNGTGDGCDILVGGSPDCNANLTPDECEVALVDCNANGTPDDCDISASNVIYDCNTNAAPDGCDIAGGASDDCDANGIPDECDAEFCYSVWDGFEPVPPFAIGTPINTIDYDADGVAWLNPSGTTTIGSQGCPASTGKALKTVAQTPPTTDFSQSEYFRTTAGALGDGAPLQSLTFDSRSEATLNPRIDWQLSIRDATNDQSVILIHWASTQSAYTGVGSARGRILVQNPAGSPAFISSGFAIPSNSCYKLKVALDNFTGQVRLYINGTLRVTTTRLQAGALRMDYFRLEQKANGQGSGGANRLALDNFVFCQTGGSLAPGGLADCNANGVLDRCDIAAGAAGDCEANSVPDSCEHPGDFDCDGDVDSADADVIRSCFSGSGHPPAAGCGPADLDADGDVDCADWNRLRNAWTQGTPPGFRRCPQVTPAVTPAPQAPTPDP